MNETSKAVKRRYNDPAFHLRYYSGHGIDIGSGADPLGRYVGQFARMTSCRGWDLKDGDAQHLKGVDDNAYDFLNSSHCLEHLHDPWEGLRNWLRVVKPGGFVVVTVPDADLYESMAWPSRWNADHKWLFSLGREMGVIPRMVNVLEMLRGDTVPPLASPERIQLVRDFWDDSLAGTDQTLSANTESCIEFVLRKHG